MGQRLQESSDRRSESDGDSSSLPDAENPPSSIYVQSGGVERGSYRFPAEPLRLQLLGGVRAGPGLIRRVHHRVEQLSSPEGPGYRTGSVIPTGTSSHEQESQDGLIEQVSELCIALVEWQARRTIGSASAKVGRDLITYLRVNRITDVDYLTKSKLPQIRAEVTEMLHPESPPSSDMDRCEVLRVYLVTWMGDCPHIFQRLPGDEGTSVMRCHCGAGYTTYGNDETWFAAG